MRFYIHQSIIAAVLALGSSTVVAQTAPASLKEAVESAWQRAPQGRTLEARRSEIEARRDAAKSWIAGSPSVGLSQQSDRWTDHTGFRETEISLSAPIWLPGQVSARVAQSNVGADDLEAQIANARLALAGEVRERLWSVAAAREALAEAIHRQQFLDDTVEEVMDRVKVGELARTDGMLAQQEALASKSAVIEAQARLQEALSRFVTLTGLPDIPAAEPEQAATGMREPHPRLLAARTALEHAQATVNVIAKTANEPPTIGMSAQREREGTGERTSRVVFSAQIPIGTAVRNRPLETAAQTQVVAASAEIAQTEAVLQSEIELARHQIVASRQALESASSRLSLAREHARLIEKAFWAGERPLVDMLRAHSVQHEAEVGERQQRIAVGLAHARLNQALGITP